MTKITLWNIKQLLNSLRQNVKTRCGWRPERPPRHILKQKSQLLNKYTAFGQKNGKKAFL